MSFIKWKISAIAKIAKNRTDNHKDLIMAITGPRGEGKSTFAYKLASRLSVTFNPKKDILYSIEDVLDWYTKNKNRVLIFDEAIAAHNREFFNEIQKKLIRMLNMYRDSCNVLLLCIPNFNNLDVQVRQLARARIHITERGKGLLLLPKLGVHLSDSWETEYNNKIEKQYVSNNRKVNYTRISTFQGFIYFTDLTDKQKETYEKIKQEKRNAVYKIKEEDTNIHDKVYTLLKEGKISSEGFNQICLSNGIPLDAMRKRMARKLGDEGRDTKIVPLFKKPVVTSNP